MIYIFFYIKNIYLLVWSESYVLSQYNKHYYSAKKFYTRPTTTWKSRFCT